MIFRRKPKGFRFPNGIPRVPTVVVNPTPAQRKETPMISKYWKAIIAFVGVLGTAVAATAADPTIAGVLPTGAGGWITAAGAALTTALVWLKANEPTVEQAEKLLEDARDRAGF